MSQQPPNTAQQGYNQFPNQQQGQNYQGQPQGQTNQASSQLGSSQSQQYQQGQPGQTNQGQQNQWQQGQQSQNSQGVQNQNENYQKPQGQQQGLAQNQQQQLQQPQTRQQQWQAPNNQQTQPNQQSYSQQPQQPVQPPVQQPVQQQTQSQIQPQKNQGLVQQNQPNQSQQGQPQQAQNTQWQQGQQGQTQTYQSQSNTQQQNSSNQPNQNQWQYQPSQNHVNQQGNTLNQAQSNVSNQPATNPVSQSQWQPQNQNSQWQAQSQLNNQTQPNTQQQFSPQKSQSQQSQGNQNQQAPLQNTGQVQQNQSNQSWQYAPNQQGPPVQPVQPVQTTQPVQQGQQGQQLQQGQRWQQGPQNNQLGQSNQLYQQGQLNQSGQIAQNQQSQPQNINNQPVANQNGQNSPQKGEQSPDKKKKTYNEKQKQKQKEKKAQKEKEKQKQKQKKAQKEKEKEKQKEKQKEKKKQKEKEKQKQKDKKNQGASDKKADPNVQAPLQTGVIEEPPKNMNSNQIIAYMKKKPYSQKIGNIEYTYSVISKKQETFVGSHDRFLYLKGYQSISYAREFDAKTTLPFVTQDQVPKAKKTYPITQIEKYVNQQQKLIIQFSGTKKVKWEFVCPSKDSSLRWKRKIEQVKKTLEEFKQSGSNNFDEFLRIKQANALQQQLSQQQNVNNFLSNPNISTFNNINNNQPNNNQVYNQFPQQGGNQYPQQNNGQNIQQNNGQYSQQQSTYQSSQQQQKNPNKPTSVLYQGPQAAKINNFIEGNQEQRSYLNQSMSRIPWEGKEGIKNEIRKIKRNWIDDLLGGEEEVQLYIQFKNYVQRIAEVIVNQLYVPQQAKMYTSQEFTKESALYVLDDVYIEIYFNFDDNPSIKNPKYKTAVDQFKNFEYLLSVTKNEGILKVPFMTLFEYKGFLGMAKSKVGESRGFKNKQFCEYINKRQFQDITRISADVLLNESKCKIVSYDIKNNTGPRISTSQTSRIYFVERLTDFLPISDKDIGKEKILRRQLVSDEEFEDQVFRDRNKGVRNDKISSIVQKKIQELVSVLENQDTYFTNSQELTELIHLYGLNIYHLGAIFKKTRLSWLKRIFQAEIAARCLKNIYRLDIQNSIFHPQNQYAQERQEDRQRNRVISFLNVIFGNTEPTFRLWRNINTAAIDKYRTKIWDNEFTDVNTGYLLQAVQTHFKITLTENVSQRNFFKSMSSFGPRDFVQFNFDATVYNLDFTNTFELIHESIEEANIESFQTVGEILTKQTSNHVPYLDLLKNHPIHEKISLFFLNFISPEDNSELYNKIESKYLPHKFLYESKFAQIKWFLKSSKPDRITKAASFIQDHARRWLGQVHPLFTQLNRLLAEYFSEMQIYYSKALKYATTSLDMQRALFEGDSEALWRDYFLIGKIHFINSHVEEALTYLTKAKNLVKVEKLSEFEVYGELCLMLAKGYFGARYYKESYSIVRELYKTIREERDERSLVNIVEAVTLIKQLLQINQEHESYYKFVQSDFSSIVYAFADYPALMNQSIKMITIPYLKNVILRNSKNKVRLLNIIEEISKIKQSPNSYNAYIKAKISEGTFPKSYLHCLKEIDSVIDEILANQMIERWKSFNNLANQSILDKIGNSQINRGFDFLANMTALFNLLGQEVLEELFIMEK